MPSLYDVLGLTKATATDEEVRAAYRKLALLYHPDKRGEEGHALMQKLNEAYEALQTEEGRQAYEAKWEFSAEAADESPDFIRRRTQGFLDTSGEAYSENFRRQYGGLCAQYRIKPLQLFAYDMRASNVYLSPLDTSYHSSFRDIYAVIHDNTKPVSREEIKYMNERVHAFERGPLNEQTAIRLFLEFLDGVYTADAVARLVVILEQKKTLAAKALVYNIAYPLYEALIAILTYQPGSGASRSLAGLFPILKKISDYAQAAANNDSAHYAILLQNSYFRHFYNTVLNDYWWVTDNIFTERHLHLFDGRDTARQLLQNITRQLSKEPPASVTTEVLREIATLFNTLYRFEKDKEEARSKASTPEALRELGFRVLDWMPALLGNGHAMIANTFMQAAICFQRASQAEKNPLNQMADESLAVRLYSTAIDLASHTTPDIHLQIMIYCIKYMGKLRYQETILAHNLPIFQKRALLLVEVFPLVRNQQANIDWLVSDNSFLPLLRHYLHTLVDIIRNNANDNQSFVIIDVDYVAALYQAYEACLKGWYKNSFEPNPEEKVRLLLMEEALARQGWTLDDLNKNLQAPHIMLERDNAGWLVPRESLPIKRDPNVQVFRSIDGLKVDFARGEITFSVKPWSEQTDPECRRVVTAADLMEILYRNLAAAVFSLDPVDPYRFYYPFNNQRIIPSGLYRTQLHHAMLITDYWLKFLTVGSEVQGDLPYNQRPIGKLIERLPKYLKKIITDFHEAQSNDGIHRFWIEALEVDIAEKTTGEGKNQMSYFSLNNLQMVVKKHRMRRNEEGELVDTTDTDEDYEGWHFYVKNDQPLNRDTLRKMKSPAIIFLGQTGKYTLWEGGDNAPVPSLPLQNYTHQLNQFFQFPRDADGRVSVIPHNELFLYQLTRKIARQNNKLHHFTPEQIFAYEFTAHYDEFSLYFPIFERLRQLSKMTIIVRILGGIKKSAEDKIVELQEKLDDITYWKSKQQEINSAVLSIEQQIWTAEAQAYNEKTTAIMKMFDGIRADFNQETLRSEEKENLRGMYHQIGTLNFSSYSAEINEMYEKNLQANRDNIIRQYGYNGWSQAESDIRRQLDNARSEWARQLSDSKRNSIENQLRDIFGRFFDSYSLQSKIDAFLRGDIDSIAIAIADKKYTEALDSIVRKICENNSMWSQAEVRHAITSLNPSPYSELIKKAVDYNLSNFRSSARAEITRLHALIEGEKTHIRDAQAHSRKTITSIVTLGLGRDENKDDLKDEPPINDPSNSEQTQKKYHLYLQIEGESLPSPQPPEKNYPLLLLNKEGVPLCFQIYTPKGIQKLSIPAELGQKLYQHLAKNIHQKPGAPIPQNFLPGTHHLSFEHTQTTEPYSVEFARFNVPSDGNCFFYALEHQLKRIGYKKAYTYSELRQLAVMHMVNHIDEYHSLVAQDYIRESIDQYFERMKKDSEWAGDPEIKALSEALGVCIQVMMPNKAPRIYPEGGRPTIYLAYNGRYDGVGHYDSLIPTAELKMPKIPVLTGAVDPRIELISRIIPLDTQDSVIIYLLAQGASLTLVTQETHQQTLPRSLRNQCLWVPASIAHTHHRFVYGGVSITPHVNMVQVGTPQFQAMHNQAFASTGQTLQSGSTFAAQASAASHAAAAPPTGGGSSSGAGGGSGRPPSGTPPTGGGEPPNSGFDRKVITQGFQDHHIISPTNAAHRSHRVLQLANFDLESRANKIFLPPTAELHSTRSLHSGRHTNDAIKSVTVKMNEIFEKGQKEGWNQSQYHDALRNMLKEVRTELKAGNIPLNSRSRPWASFSH